MNIGIIGLGLIGGSLARSFRKTGNIVYGYDISEQTMLKAELLNAYNYKLNDDNYKDLDIVIIAVYPRSFESVLNQIAPKLTKGAVIMDIAGNKHAIVTAMKKTAQNYPDLNFVATHPMAGREFWGISHSTTSLFDKASLLMVPVVIDIAKLVAVKKLFLDIGFSSVVMTNEKQHDKMIAYTSQLPHIISSSYVKSPTAESHDGFSSGSFRDMTRVAKLNSAMWSELMYDNRENILVELEVLIRNLEEYKSALANGDESKLKELLEDGNNKKEIIEKATREWKRTHNESN